MCSPSHREGNSSTAGGIEGIIASLGGQPVQRVTDDVNRYSVAIKCNLYILVVHSPQTSCIRKLTASGSSSINSQLAETILYFCKTDGSNGSHGKVGGVLGSCLRLYVAVFHFVFALILSYQWRNLKWGVSGPLLQDTSDYVMVKSVFMLVWV